MRTIEYKKTFFKVADFVSWQKDKALILSPKFQRRSVWKPGTKSYLIDTIVRGLPIPIIFLRDLPIDLETLRPQREVVDGQQRLRTVLSFVAPQSLEDYNPQEDQFTVQKNHNKEIAGKTFQQLDDDIKRDILEYEFSVHIFSPRMDNREVIDIFRRMNSTSYPLNKQELRNAEYFGKFKTLAYELALECLCYWKSWEIFNDEEIARMDEVKLTSELIIMMIEGKLFDGSYLDSKIDKFYNDYNDELDGYDEIYNYFHKTMKVIDANFKNLLPSSKFSQSTKIYVLFSVIYDLMFGLDSISSKKYTKNKVTQIPSKVIENLRIAIDNLDSKKPEDIGIDQNKYKQSTFEYLIEYVKRTT
ncbi:MAG: DUF262 domain-containing protein [Crocosphaera sp.]|nr:DUF262 domain-containing protein [Crocosphaera sp.]